MTHVTKRQLIATGLASAMIPGWARAEAPRDLSWDDLIPPGVAYAEIIGEGAMDIENDLWNPIYDENATKLNTALEGELIRMPGYMIPLELDAKGVTEFILVPYVGACIHVPPPPRNQIVYAKAPPGKGYPSEDLFDPVWVTGVISAKPVVKELFLIDGTSDINIGYSVQATRVEPYED